MAGRLGDILVRKGYLSEENLKSALQSQGSKPGMLGSILTSRGWVTAEQLGDALSEQFEVPYAELVAQSINPQVIRLLPEEFARGRMAVPIGVANRRLTLAMVAPDDIETISEAELITGYQVDPVVSMQAEVRATLDRGFDDRLVARQTAVDMTLAELEQLLDQHAAEEAAPDEVEDDAPVVKLAKSVLLGAINAKASDIHIEPHLQELRVRYRVDGECQQVMTVPKQTQEA